MNKVIRTPDYPTVEMKMGKLHDGGYSAGSSIEIPAYDGHNLSDYGDVVIVNLNHRLNCIGFMGLSSFGERYKYTGMYNVAGFREETKDMYNSLFVLQLLPLLSQNVDRQTTERMLY